MGRRINISTPTVINTELVPLDESFYIEVDGQMEQWYYDNTEQYAPNRKVTPLLLTPVISTFDKDTSTSYTPAFNTTQWFANEWNEAQGKYVETEITNQVDSGSADYVIQGNNLLVKKNVSYSHAVSIRCVATYIDPRDSGVTYAVEDSVNLTTNRTADVVFPEVDIISPSGRSYNPLVDDTNSEYEFKGVTTNNPVQPLNTDVRRYSVDVDGTEEILNSGEAVAPIMDIHYGENPTLEDQEFMYRQTADGELVGENIDKAYIERIKGNTVAWNQLVKNGDFGSGTTGWTPTNGTITANNNECTYTVTTTGIGTSLAQTLDNVVLGHKYYISLSVKYNNHVPNETGNLAPAFGFGGKYIYEENFSLGTYKRVSGIITTTSDAKTLGLYLRTQSNGGAVGDTINIKNIIVFDLTLIYGDGNEPETAEEFEADYERWFGKPLSYEAYDEGSLRPVLMQSVKTTGFNQWDGSYKERTLLREGGIEESNPQYITTDYIHIIPNAEYYVNRADGSSIYLCMYDANKVCIRSIQHNRADNLSFTTPQNACYIRDSMLSRGTYCINISNPSKNGTYEPYEEKVQGLDVTALKGKLNGAGESVTIFPDGLKKAGDVQDEIFVEDGVVKAIKRVGAVDLGSLVWASRGAATDNSFVTNLSIDTNSNSIQKSVCPRYMRGIRGAFNTLDATAKDKTYNYVTNSRIYIKDSNYTDADTFTNAMNGVMLYYELETPQTYILDPITDFVWYGIKNGQEVLADTLPWYVSGQNTDSLVVDAMYGENINVVLRCKMMDGETLSPSKAYATLSWRMPDIETFVQSDNGGAVRSDTEEMTFGTIVNVNGDVLTDALKQKHLAFNWKIRKNNTSTEVDKGWGQRITIDASELRNVRGSGSTLASTLVSNEVYLKGAYEEVTDNNQPITDGGEVVYDRPVD